MAVINGTDLLVYIDGNPVVTTNHNFNPTIDYLPITTPIEGEVTFDSLNRFDSSQWTYLQQLEYQWAHSIELPRKQKKAYRKRLSKAYIHEVYRQQKVKY